MNTGMAFSALWFTVLTSSSVSALLCEIEEGTCSTVSLRQLQLDVRRAERLDVNGVNKNLNLPATCAEGKLLPEVYLLGASKSGTTELALDMINSGIQSVAALSQAGPGHIEVAAMADKEFFFFDRWWRWNNYTWDLDKIRQAWFDSLPPCSPLGDVPMRTVMGDFTPNHLTLVPPGDGWTRVGMGVPAENHMGEDINLPVTLQAIYSHYMGLKASRVRFIVNFREPLARMQSHWYHYEDQTDSRYLPIPYPLGTNFSEDVAQALDEFEYGRITPLLWPSLYARQVQQFMSQFSPSQFMFIPYRYHTHLAKKEVCDTLAQFLSFPVMCKEVVQADTTPTHHDHPLLTEDVAPHLIERFQRVIADENHLLVQLLLHGYLAGATLANFQSSPSAGNIEAWLNTGW